MNRQDLKKYHLPDQPGVYLFKKGRTVVYVGKATSLRDRVKSYFSKDLILTRGPKILKMVAEATGLDFQTTDSVLEALILEANLIKKYNPRANTDGKDDKSFNFVVITDEEFPVVRTERGKILLTSHDKYKNIFGPYPYGSELKEALKIIRKIFPYRDEKCSIGKNRPCFNYQIGLCPGTCMGAISRRDYAKVIRSIKLFFEGKKDKLVRDLTSHMNRLARAREFEEAGEFKKKIFALGHIQDVALMKARPVPGLSRDTNFRIESYDIAHTAGTQTVGAMVVMVDGEFKKSDYRKFKLKGLSAGRSDDTGNLREILERRFKHLDWPLPDLIVVDGSTAQINIAKQVLVELDLNIPVVGVVKDEKHKAREIKGESKIIRDYHSDIIRLNAETHRFVINYHRQRRDRVL